jgi:hypothetical protein
MSEPLPQAVHDAADVSAITQLVLRERSARDLGLWEQMADCYHPDSRVRLSWIDGTGPEFVRRSREMADRGLRGRHRLGLIEVTLSGDRAIASLGGTIEIPLQLDGVEAVLSSWARFLFRAERRAGVWRLAGFDVVYQRDQLACAIPGQSVSIPPEALAPYRPSYRLLAHCVGRLGMTIRDDLPGEDRPESVAAITRELWSWAGLPVPR